MDVRSHTNCSRNFKQIRPRNPVKAQPTKLEVVQQLSSNNEDGTIGTEKKPEDNVVALAKCLFWRGVGSPKEEKCEVALFGIDLEEDVLLC